LIVALLFAASCSSDGDSTSTASGEEASTTTAAPSTTTEPEDESSESLVLEGTWSGQNEILELPEGFSNSLALEGDLAGQGAFVGEAIPDGENYTIEGDWAFNLRSPELGEGLIAVQQWDGLKTPTDFEATGEVSGVSGAFAGMVGTTSFTSTGTDEGTYVFELQPAEPSPEPEATEPLTIDYEAASGPAWVEEEYRAFGGGSTSTGDFVGSVGWTGYVKDGTGTTILINVGTVEGVGDGVFITMMPTPGGTETWTVQSEFFGISGDVAGLQGTGTTTGTTHDSTGAFAPVLTSTFEVSSDELEGISWFRRADFYDLEEGPVTVECRPEGMAHQLWGTDVYTDDSAICTAAAHAGLITLEDGGEVTFAFTEGPDVYPASERNGVTSHEGSDWPEGFEFVEPS
jgi:LCCL domain